MQFERLELLIGKEKLKRIKKTSVLVIGLGGVGSYAIESLIRSGIENITLVDYDTIDITNLNRQLMTNLNNIGEYKTEVIKDRILSINDKCKITIINSFIDENNIDVLFDEKVDYIIDCQDTIKTKEMIIERCLYNKIKFITCCGTGNKFDPSKLKIINLEKTNYDPIAKILRKWAKDNCIHGKIICCCSDETPKKINSQIIGSNSFVPASAGLLITSYIINDIIK